MDERQKWNTLYAAERNQQPLAAQVLTDNLHLLPDSGIALDLACGLGANALLLAARGLKSHAWDISDIALEKLSLLAANSGLTIHCQQRDIVRRAPEADSFDVIIVSRFLDRGLLPKIQAALRKNGLVFYQTFTRNKLCEEGPTNPEYLLERNELLQLFDNMNLLYYREDDRTGDVQSGLGNEAMIISQKP